MRAEARQQYEHLLAELAFRIDDNDRDIKALLEGDVEEDKYKLRILSLENASLIAYKHKLLREMFD